MNRLCSRSRFRNPIYVEPAPPIPFTPADLFTGQQGFWFDPSDMTTMFQDADGTVPVTAADQVVGLIVDKSGNSNGAVQATEASKPILRSDGTLWWLEFDGVDDFLSVSSLAFSSVALNTFAAVLKSSDTAIGVVMESGANIGNVEGAFIILAPATAGTATFLAGFKGTTRRDRTSPANYAAPFTALVDGIGNITDGTTNLRINGVSVASDASGLGTGTFLDNPVYIGRRGGTSLPFVGRLYGALVVETAMAASSRAKTETYLGAQAGIAI